MKRINKKFYLSVIFILLFSFSVSALDRVAVVAKSKTVIRQTPNVKGKVLLTARKGQEFTILSYNKEWIRIVISKGKYGWIPRSDVTTKIVDHFLDEI